MMKKIILGALLLLGLAGCGAQNTAPIPHYSSTKAQELLSSKKDKLNDTQEKQFWKIGRAAAKRATKGDGDAKNWKYMKDDTLYVAKTAKKQQYEIVYRVKATKPFPVKVSYDMLIKFTKNSLEKPSYKVQSVDTNLVDF